MKPWCFLLWMLAAPLSAAGLPTFDEVRKSFDVTEGQLLDRNGVVLSERRIETKGRRFAWTPLVDVSVALRSAVLRAEDRRFYDHSGVDWRAIGSALISRLSSKHLRGASTVTMQVASLLSSGLKPKNGRRDVWQKWQQMRVARELDGAWTKDQIFEAYLNLVSFRGEHQGVASASRALFDKDPHGLTETEGLILAALIRAPGANGATVAARACALKEAESALDCATLEPEVRGALAIGRSPHFRQSLAPHLATRFLSKDHKRVTTTLSAATQRFAMEALEEQHQLLAEKNASDAAVLVADNATGEVLAYVGNVASGNFVDGVRAKRQAGSSLKPFVYGLAFEQRLLTPASFMDDSPLEIPLSRGVYRPQNYDNRFHGLVSARTALASSLNIPAVRALMLSGPEALVRRLERLGLSELEGGDHYGPSLALGSADVSLWELVGAYRALANGGRYTPLRLQKLDPVGKSTRGLSADAAFLVSDILSDRGSRSLTFGLENPLSARGWAAVKTGTSKDMRDNWCIGYSDRFTVGVWFGNFSGEPMWNVTGVSGAAPVWISLMNHLHREAVSRAPKMPRGVVEKAITLSGREPDRREVFLRGTEMAAIAPNEVVAAAAIENPVAGTIFAIDPDIPDERQRIGFRAVGTSAENRWELDGVLLGVASETASWIPKVGEHRLAILDGAGNRLTESQFEVRGEDLAEPDVSEEPTSEF